MLTPYRLEFPQRHDPDTSATSRTSLFQAGPFHGGKQEIARKRPAPGEQYSGRRPVVPCSAEALACPPLQDMASPAASSTG